MADLKQGATRLAGIFAAATWADAPSALVLTGGAKVSDDEPGNFLSDPPNGMTPDGPPDLEPPFAIVTRGPFVLVEGRYTSITYHVMVTAGSGGITNTTDEAGTTGDTHGVQREAGLLRDPVQGQGKSGGKTADEVASRLIESLTATTVGGLPGQLVPSVHGLQGYVDRGSQKDLEDGAEIQTASFDVIVTDGTVARTYPAPRQVKATAAGGGAVTIAWALPALTADFDTIVLRRGTNPGDPAPTAPSGAGSGTGIALSGPQATTATDSGHVAAQQFNYAAFALYSEVNAGDRASSGTPSNTVTVT